MPPESNAWSPFLLTSLRKGMVVTCFGTWCCYTFNPAVKIWPSIANLPKIHLRRQREAAWHYLTLAFTAGVNPRRAQGQCLSRTWCLSGLRPPLCWFYSPQALIMKGKAREEQAERKAAGNVRDTRQVCWCKGSQALSLGLRARRGLQHREGKGRLANTLWIKVAVRGERSLHKAFASAGQEGPSILHALFSLQPQARPGAQMSFWIALLRPCTYLSTLFSSCQSADRSKIPVHSVGQKDRNMFAFLQRASAMQGWALGSC